MRFPAALRTEVEAAVREAGGVLMTPDGLETLGKEDWQRFSHGLLCTWTDKASGDEIATMVIGTGRWRRALLETLTREPLNCVVVEEADRRSGEAAARA